MTMFAIGLLLSLVLAPQEAPSVLGGFHPDEHLTPPGGPEVVIFRSVPPNVVSLRLSVPFQEAPEEGGAGQLLQIQAQDRMESLAQRIGARVEVHRTPQALVYQVSGALADLDFLSWILREGVHPPAPGDLAAARQELLVEADRRLETPQGVLASRVRAAAAPEAASIHGTPGSIERLDASRLTAIWARSHRRENLRLVVAGRVPTEMVLAAVAELATEEVAAPTLSAPLEAGSPTPAPEVIRYWVADAYRLPGGGGASALVAGRWLAEVARADGGDFELGVEIWDVAEDRLLVVSGAAYARSRQAMEQRLGGLATDAASRLTPGDVDRLANELRTEILMTGRTPWGLAELVGQAWDAGRGPEGVESLLTELLSLSESDVAEALDGFATSTPIREELLP